MNGRQARSLRSILAWTTSLVVGVALVASAALVLLTSLLHRTTVDAAAATEGVRLAEEAENDLLQLDDASDARSIRRLEDDLRDKLVQAGRFVTSEREVLALNAAEQAVEVYLAALGDPATPAGERAAQRKSAHAALVALVSINTLQSQEAHRDAERWNRLADGIGLATVAVLLSFAAGTLVALRRRAFAPLFALAAVIERFRGGARDARAATEDGALEFRIIARRFNEMADTLERQRSQQLAFLAGVAHDLRNPLTALKMSSGLIPPDGPLPDEARVRALFARMQRQADRLDRMVSDFLDAARIESGHLELRPEECDLRELVHTTAELFQPSASGHRFVLELPEEPARTTCDPARLEQVLNNLVSNAIKYSPNGGTLRVSLVRSGETLRLAVADQGMGIAADDLEHIFEPFRRSSAAKAAVPGVGLGLSVARRIVEAHGGRLVVDSAPGRGSTFTVELPARVLADGSGVAPPTRAAARPATPSPPTA